MWRLEKDFRFEAAHYLPYHDGKCKRLHGHSWRGKIVVVGPSLQTDGPQRSMLVDFAEMKAAVKKWVDDYLDHEYLNDKLVRWGIESPTSEEIARWLFDRIKVDLPGLKEVWIEETCTSRCMYCAPPGAFNP